MYEPTTMMSDATAMLIAIGEYPASMPGNNMNRIRMRLPANVASPRIPCQPPMRKTNKIKRPIIKFPSVDTGNRMIQIKSITSFKLCVIIIKRDNFSSMFAF